MQTKILINIILQKAIQKPIQCIKIAIFQMQYRRVLDQFYNIAAGMRNKNKHKTTLSVANANFLPQNWSQPHVGYFVNYILFKCKNVVLLSKR